MSIALDVNGTTVALVRTSPTALPQPKLYTSEDAYVLLNGNPPNPLKDIFLRCRDPKMCLLKYKLDLDLDEEFIIRYPYSQKLPVSIYNLDGNRVAYIDGAWGDSVVLPRDAGIDSYTDFASDCPILIMRLVEQNGRESTHLTHINSDSIDDKIAYISYSLRENKKLLPKEIVFSPRTDSRYFSAMQELERFGGNIEVEIIRRNNHSARALVTPNGWCLSDECSISNHSLNSLIAGRLWGKN